LKHFRVPEGFSVELVAAEPDVVNPIAMCFDDRGRIWITESVEYPRKPAGVGRDRVKILEDVDGDGRAEKVTTFANDLNIPTGIATGRGGVWVLNAPDLLFYREENGQAISREVVLTGFGRTDTHELPNSLTWGPDGWLYGMNGVFNECRIVSKGREFKFNCALWRLHPGTREFEIVSEGTSNPYGLAWDSEGAAIVEACHWANDHLFHFVENGHYQRQAGAFPPYTMKLGSITDHGHQKTAYCGLTIFDSPAYPEKYRGLVYVGNIHAGCINVDRLERDGATYLAKAEPDFLTADDAWFMPVALKIGPDGCMYVLDWYDRYHCSQDAARDPEGVDRAKGRLYRVRYKETPRAPKFDLAKESDAQLITRLGSENLFFRESAERLLGERMNPAIRARLQEMILEKATPRKERLQALWTRTAAGELPEEFHLALLNDNDPAVRAWAVRAARSRNTVSPEFLSQLTALASDRSADVQLQVVNVARRTFGVDALPLIVETLAHCGHDKMIPAIAWNNLHPLLEGQSARFAELFKKFDSPALRTLGPLAVDRILGFDAASVRKIIDVLNQRDVNRAREAFALIAKRLPELSTEKIAALRTALESILQSTDLSAQLLAARLGIKSVEVAAVRARFESAGETEAVRLQALESLIAFRDDGLLKAIEPALTSNSPAFVTRVLNLLGRIEDPKLADVLLGQYTKLRPELQPLALDLLLQREPWARQLLKAVREKRIPVTLSANHLRKILESNDREAIWEVEKVFGKIREERNPEREKVVAEMANYLREHLGDARAGREVFRKTCAQCHTIYGEGGNVGPDISSNGRASFDQLLSNVFDPSLAIAPAYQVTTIVTLDGRNLTGLVTEEGDQRVVLKMPGEGLEAVPRANIKYAHLSKLSMMPEGLENLMDRRELADLFAFLALDRAPDDPGAKAIPGAPVTKRTLRLDRGEKKMVVRMGDVELLNFVMDPAQRPFLHPVRDASGAQVLTDDRPADHPWQHGIFTGFHGLVCGHEFWMENDGHQHFARLLDVKEAPDKIAWRALTEFPTPGGEVFLQEEDAYTVNAPVNDSYAIDFTMTLRALNTAVEFEKAAVGGLAVRMPWNAAHPEQTHLNSNGQQGRACEKQRANWCNVERPFAGQTYGIVVLDHPSNANHPPAWRVDEQGLINPSVTSVTAWTLPANTAREFRYRILIYKESAMAETLDRAFSDFANTAAADKK